MVAKCDEFGDGWDVAENAGVMLCSSEDIIGSSSCLAEDELRWPSRATVADYVLPTKIHFRYCWLFSGAPLNNTLDTHACSNTEQELVRVNRVLMTGDDYHLCSRISQADLVYPDTMKAFWLTTDARLVCVERMSEDIKFRSVRERNRRVALSQWTNNPEMCGQTLREARVAHSNLVRICGQAATFSRGKFYNLYARYPLPTDCKQTTDFETIEWIEEREIFCTEIINGKELVTELRPLYATYFSFITNTSTSNALRDRVSLLGAQWMIEEERSELMFTLTVKHSWLKRAAVKLALLLSVS